MDEDLSVEDKAAAVIEEALGAAGILTTGWVFVATVIDHDGASYLIRAESEDLTDVERTGMFTEALNWVDE